MTWFTVKLTLFVAAMVIFLMPSSAGAAGGKNYGTWFPPPGSGDSRAYQAVIDPASSARVAEITDFSCYFTQGTKKGIPLDARQKRYMRDHINIATKIYSGQPDRYNGGDDDSKVIRGMALAVRLNRDSDGEKGLEPTVAMQMYLQGQKKVFKNEGVVWNGSFDESKETQEWWGIDDNGRTKPYPESLQGFPKGGSGAPILMVPSIVSASFLADKDVGGFGEQKKPPGGRPGTGAIYAGGSAGNDNFNPATRPGWMGYDQYLYQDGTDNAEPSDNATEAIQNLPYAPSPDSDLANAVNVNAKNPLQLANRLSQGCALDPLQQEGPGGLGDLIKEPGQWFEDLFFWIVGQPVRAVYNFLQPKAFLYSFWTPHVERGDTILNTRVNGCRQVDRMPKTGEISGVTGATGSLEKFCRGTKPLGFSVKNLKDKGHDSVYMQIAFFLQWLVSGTYFIIMFAAAIVYMVRGSKAASFNVLQIIPRIIISVILTMFGPWLIGLGIFLSNMFVQALFNYNDQATVGAINSILNAAPVFLDGNEFFSRILQVIVGASAAFFYAVFLLGAILRNIALILIIALMPLACFCLIVPAWQSRFALFFRTTVAVVFLPAIMAFILKIGLSINPLVWWMESGKEDITGWMPVFGLLLLVVTLWAMARSGKIARAYATSGGQGALFASGMANAAGMLHQAGMAGYGGKWGSRALRAAGQGAALGSAAAYAANDGTAALVPQHKGMLAGGGSQGPSSLRKGMERAQQQSGLANSDGLGPGAFMNPGDFLQKRFAQRAQLHQGSSGERVISAHQAQRMRMQESAALDRRIDAKRQELGRDLTRRELRGVKDEFYNGSLDRYEDPVTGAMRVRVDNHGNAIRANDGWNDKMGSVSKRGGRYVVSRDSENFNGQGRVRAAWASFRHNGPGGSGEAIGGAIEEVGQTVRDHNPVTKAGDNVRWVKNQRKYGSKGYGQGPVGGPAPGDDARSGGPDEGGGNNNSRNRDHVDANNPI